MADVRNDICLSIVRKGYHEVISNTYTKEYYFNIKVWAFIKALTCSAEGFFRSVGFVGLSIYPRQNIARIHMTCTGIHGFVFVRGATDELMESCEFY